MALDVRGNLYIAARGEHRIRKVTAATGIITTIAGNSTGVDSGIFGIIVFQGGFSGDGGPATSALLNDPEEIALDAEPGPDALPRLVERQAPVDRDGVAAGCRHALQEVGAAGAEVDEGDTGFRDPGEDPLDVGEHPALVVAPAQRSDPGVEELEDVDSRPDLGAQVAHGHLGELLHQLVPQLGLAVHQRLAAGVIA